MAGLDISEKRLPQDGRFEINVKGQSIDIRLSTMPTSHGESVVMRLADHSGEHTHLEAVGMPHEMLQQFKQLITRPNGLVLVTGPTGSGKTTTLYGALNFLNAAEKKIITVEDPVEYQLERVNQVQVMPKIGLDFARVLRATLRQDPDILLVGEIRDAETAEIALRAAMTGHLVLSTLHTNDAVSSALRLLDIGVEGYMVATAVRGIVAQRLIRQVCERCVQLVAPDEQQQAWLQNTLGEAYQAERQYSHGKGCNHCNRTGYFGRLGVFEMLQINAGLADAMRQNDAALFARRALTQDGFRPLVHAALRYAEQGRTSLEEVMALSNQEEDPILQAQMLQLDDAADMPLETALENNLLAAQQAHQRNRPPGAAH